MSLRSLAKELSRLEPFAAPKLELEQYATHSDIAAELLWTALMQGDVEGKHVVDLGAGTGMLGIGALLLDADKVTFVEIDSDANEILRKNVDDDRAEIIEADATAIELEADCVIMNPPFGAQQKHADKAFLESALGIAPRVYSIHNANSEPFLRKFARDHEVRFDLIGVRTFPLPRQYAHHEKERVMQQVLLCRFSR